MAKCPDCMKEYREHKKKWKYGKFDVEAYMCVGPTSENIHEKESTVSHSNLRKAKATLKLDD